MRALPRCPCALAHPSGLTRVCLPVASLAPSLPRSLADKIPFATSIRITVTMPFPGIIYYYARGMTSLPVTVGGLQLPPAARLRLYKNWNVTVKPLEKLSLVPNRTGAGLLYATMWSASSKYIGAPHCVPVALSCSLLPTF